MLELSVRPLKEEDISHLVDYWFESSDEDLLRMGVDKTKLVSRESFHLGMLKICHTPVEVTNDFYMVWLIDGEPVGHNALRDIIKNKIAHMHLHMWNEKLRGKGYGARLFCLSALEFYRLFNLKIILCEPSYTNLGPNQMLGKIGYEKWRTYVAKSSVLSLACELNSFVVDEKTSLNFLNKLN